MPSIHTPFLSRRALLASGAVAATLTAVPAANAAGLKFPTARKGNLPMHSGYVTTKDNVQIFYKDWGPRDGQPIVFSHGWPLTADDWDAQMLHFGSIGYRVIAHDRRGHGRSSQTWDGNDMDHYADDLKALVEHLDLKKAVHIGHSTGGGEVTRYLGRHGTARASKAVLLGAVPPLMLKTADNPGGLPRDVFDGIRAGTASDRSQFFYDLTMPFYNYNRPGATISEGQREAFRLMGLQGGIKAEYDCIKAFSETDFREDLRKIDIPTLIIHGDDDQIVPIGAAALESAKLVKNSKLLVYKGAGHAIAVSHRDQFHKDFEDFLKS